jgi:hypothetical protein
VSLSSEKMVITIRKNIKKKKDLEKLLKLVKPRKPFKASQFCGKVKVREDAVLIQRRLRNEWK